MSRIDDLFRTARDEGRLAFMPFVTAGDPDLDGTGRLVRALADQNVDLIELGFPYSDPIADGPVIQSSYTRALGQNLTLNQIFDAVKEWETDSLPPIVAMVSFALIFRTGPEQFLDRAREAGFAGLIVPDLPADEAEELAGLATERKLDLVQLIAPTTSADRVEKVLRLAKGFLYCISVSGVTGARTELPEELSHQLRDLKNRTDVPLAVGFGISQPEQVRMLSDVADGIIVGSAIVRHMEGITNDPHDLEAAIERVSDFAAEMVAAARGEFAS